MTRLFISYRRDDTAGFVGLMYADLQRAFGAARVFRDIHAIEAGEDFVKAVNDAIAECAVMLVVIGPAWLGASRGDKRRLDEPQDLVRIEVEGGLKRGVAVIPVLVHDAQMPTEGDLPADLAPLARLQAVELSESHWTQDIETLVKACERRMGMRRTRKWALAAAGVLTLALTLVIGFVALNPLGRNESPPGGSGEVPGAPAASSPPGATAASSTGRVLFDDDFVADHRLSVPQTRYNAGPAYCRTEYVQDGLLVEAVSADEACEFVLYEAPFMPSRVRIDISMRLRRASAQLTGAAYGIRLIEAKPDDPDSPLSYHAAIVGVDDFEIVETRSLTSRALSKPFAENIIRAGAGASNALAVEVAGRSLTWLLNGQNLGTVTAGEALSGSLSVYVKGRGMQVVFRNLRVAELPG